MKILVATEKGGLDDNISGVFGRSAVFTIVEVEDGKIKNVEIVKNDSACLGGGVGIKASQFVVDQNIDVAISGRIGPNAFNVLKESGVVAVIAEGNVKDAVQDYIDGKLKPAKEPNCGMKHGWNK